MYQGTFQIVKRNAWVLCAVMEKKVMILPWLLAMHEVWYAMAGSNQCQLADTQHVEKISGNARQVFEDQLYKVCGAQLQNKPPM